MSSADEVFLNLYLLLVKTPLRQTEINVTLLCTVPPGMAVVLAASLPICPLHEPAEDVVPAGIKARLYSSRNETLFEDDASASRNGFKLNLHFSVVERAPPDQPTSRFPDRNAPDLERVAGGVVVHFKIAASHSRIEAHRDGSPGIVEIARAPFPPRVDIFGENLERGFRIDVDIYGCSDAVGAFQVRAPLPLLCGPVRLRSA